MHDFQLFVWFLSIVSIIPMLIWMLVLGLYILGLPPFHKPTPPDTQGEFFYVPIPIARCPKCGYTSQEFLAFTKKL
jgi:hypothetical protein